MTPRLLTLLACAACSSPRGPSAPAPSAVSASPGETRPCEGPTAIPPAVSEILSRLESPVRDHCERHALGPASALFIRTMNTVAHDDEGDPIPTCHWEVFRTDPVRHLGSLSACRFRLDGPCAQSLDPSSSDSSCLGPDGLLHPRP